MPCASSGCEPDSIWCPPTPPPTFNSAVIHGWLADQPVSPRLLHSERKRARSPLSQAPQPKRRRPLQPTHANISRRSPRRKDSTEQLSPSRKARGRERDVFSDEGYVEESAVLRDTATTPTPSGSYTSALAHHPILRPSNTNSSSSSVRSGKSKRATSPAKTYSDLQLLNKPVKYGVMDAERDDLPEDIRVLIEDLQALCENVGIIPSKM